MIDIKLLFKILGLWILAIACLSVMDTIIFHPANSIFNCPYFDYPIKYTGQFGDAWHLFKLFGLTLFFSAVLVGRKMKVMVIIFYVIIFMCFTALVHWALFHNLLIK